MVGIVIADLSASAFKIDSHFQLDQIIRYISENYYWQEVGYHEWIGELESLRVKN